MRIVELKSENVKRLQAVEIKPNGNVVVIGGMNGAGKSSVLDSIQWALGGEPDAKMPVRKGEDKAKIVVDLGDLVVTRTITAAGGGSLVVRNADEMKQESPQAILDKLVGRLTFDPLEFSRQKPKQQAETLRALVGLDFTAHDAKREQVFDERTAVNREATALKNRLAAMPKHEGLPDAESSAADVMAAQAQAAATNANNAAQRREYDAALNRLSHSENLLADLERQAAEMAKRIEKGRAVVAAEKASAKALEEAVEKLKDVDVEGYRAKLSLVESQNIAIRQNKARAEVVSQFKAKNAEAERLTSWLEKLDAEKRTKINAAKYPIEGLAFDTAGGVTLNGIPFEQCSSAEQLRVSVAIGLALNPKLRVLLIRDGSLLDQNGLAMIAEMASKADAQIWIERVGKAGDVSVIIEDGHVLEPEAA